MSISRSPFQMKLRRSASSSDSSSQPPASESYKNKTADHKPFPFSTIPARVWDFCCKSFTQPVISSFDGPLWSPKSSHRNPRILKQDPTLTTSSEPVAIPAQSSPNKTKHRLFHDRKMADYSSPSNQGTMSTSAASYERRRMQNERRLAAEREHATADNLEAMDELGKEKIEVRDFAYEALEKEKAERNRQVDEYMDKFANSEEAKQRHAEAQIMRKEDDEDDARAAEEAKKAREAEEEAKKALEVETGKGKERQTEGYGGAGGEWGKPMDTD